MLARFKAKKVNYLTCGGSSETTREAVTGNLREFEFSDYEKHKPAHVKKLDINFLTWLVGFIEGDGSFWSSALKEAELPVGKKTSETSLVETIETIEKKSTLPKGLWLF
uniref:Homing endonuclease LAGLIDADG domain-containing protein n=1 Tax=Haematococcus lacustris TaxID=44745 RepID=A0A2K9YRX8_HAELA|nr:hypothetical protein SG3EUKT976172.1 [Haematococcus lacustris]AUW36507.1 hypothetical protein SG3EUKT976172.1 [Haematococcus lacustris]